MLRNLMSCAALVLASGAMAADEVAKEAASAPAAAARTDAAPAAKPAADESSPEKEESEETKRDAAKSEGEGGAKMISGMSILGNQEAPKSLVIVPWKSSQIGDMNAFSRVLDETTQPVDKEVFMRELAYYSIRSE